MYILMKFNNLILLPLFSVFTLLNACSSAGNTGTSQASKSTTINSNVDFSPQINTPIGMPRAVIYRTNGDYNLNVPVTLNSSGTQILSYPAPHDVKGQEPTVVGDGWLLDHRGISKNSAFLDYTYDEYQKLTDVDPTELMRHIIKGAAVTQLEVLPMTTSQAISNPDEVKKIIATQNFKREHYPRR